MEFRKWLLNEITAGKTGNYPLGYGQIGNLPPQCFLASSADAIYYMSIDDRLKYIGVEGAPHSIKHIPGKPSHLKSSEDGDGPPWSIKHVPGKSSHSGKTTGDGSPWSIKKLPK